MKIPEGAIPKKVGIRIRELRNKAKLSQETLALMSQLDRTYINSVENGRRNVSMNTVYKITHAFGITIRQFFTSDLFSED